MKTAPKDNLHTIITDNSPYNKADKVWPDPNKPESLDDLLERADKVWPDPNKPEG